MPTLRDENHLERYRKAIEVLKEHSENFSYKRLSERLEEIKKMQEYKNLSSIASSDSQLNRIYNRKQELFPNLLKLLEIYLKRLSFVWDEKRGTYILENGEQSLDIAQTQVHLPNLRGIYEVYHLSARGGTIIKNILLLEDTGKVVIKGYGNAQHLGQAQVFDGSLISIQITTIEHSTGLKENFFYQFISNLGNHLRIGEITHFVAVATTISLDKEPMATKRLFVRLHNQTDAKTFAQYQHQTITQDDKKAIEALNKHKIGRIADFIYGLQNLSVQEKVNDNIG
ncbi:hypothetical protein [Hugenholtzia roseola]|uniref:hypothetical protein n=1 Tax=Hugenholtzia roseola TaxID=1002 RepID=UPI0004044A85|nr:hypothetical protein [Hugenholtzia roseola]